MNKQPLGLQELRGLAREFVLFTASGALFGAAVGFFLFLRLGFPS
jgi:hypothetical protein